MHIKTLPRSANYHNSKAKMRNLVSIFAILAVAHAAQDAGLIVLTQQGAVAGTQVLPTVRQFLGIPFATAQRWEAPQLP